ncbi:hypothetical protein K0N88_001210 [Salmonella enterica]|nr:hypothetical protein [Salmonella enterica]
MEDMKKLEIFKNLEKMINQLTERVAILEAVAVAEAPETLEAIHLIYSTAKAVVEAE